MKTHAIYRTSTGELVGTVGTSTNDLPSLDQGQAILQDIHPMVRRETHYVLNGAIVERPVMPLVEEQAEAEADGQDVVRISGVPGGTDIMVKSGYSVVADGVNDDGDDIFEFTSDEPLVADILFTNFPYQDSKVRVIFNAS